MQCSAVLFARAQSCTSICMVDRNNESGEQQTREHKTNKLLSSKSFVCVFVCCLRALLLFFFHQGVLRSELARLRKERAQGSPGRLDPPGSVEHRVAPNLPLKEAHTTHPPHTLTCT